MPTCCCVPGCSNRGGIAFPKRTILRSKWIQAVRRESLDGKHKLWEPKSTSVVCHSHFKSSDYITTTAAGTSPLYRKRKADAVPSIFDWTSGNEHKTEERQMRYKKRCILSSNTGMDNCSDEVIVCDTSSALDIGTECEITTTIITESEIKDNDDSAADVCIKSYEDVLTNTDPRPNTSVDQFIDDDEGMLFYTGLASYTDFLHVLKSLGEASYHLNYLYSQVTNVSVENQLFLTLIKLRLHRTNFELCRMFATSQKTVENIWLTWINFMKFQWSELNLWPSRDLVRYFSPSDFFAKFPTTRLIIDGTECPVMKPKPPVAQQSTYSTYKNRNTVKVLVGCTPGGAVSFISNAYGGSTSDRQIVERSALTTMCDPGDSIMSDKGFNVQDLFATSNISINIPTFFKKKNRMTGKTVLRDRKISSKRVHIERVIGLAKTFKILKFPLNATETMLASEIIFVCFMLCNFKRCIIPKNA